MSNFVAKSRVGLAADGKTLVDANSEESVSLFAAEKSVRSEKDLAGKANASKYFAKEGEVAEVKTHTAPAGHTRVEPKPEDPHAKAAHVRK